MSNDNPNPQFEIHFFSSIRNPNPQLRSADLWIFVKSLELIICLKLENK